MDGWLPWAAPVAERASAVAGLVLAAGKHHHHAVKILILVVIGVIVIAVAGFTAAALVRRARRGRPAGQPKAPLQAGTQAAPAASAAIAVEHLTKTYRMGTVLVQALDDVSLEIGDGAMVCIMSKSGSGKSTLLRQLGLIDRPTGGRVWLHQREVTALSERERTGLRLSRLGYVFQEYALLPELTARENVYLPAMMLGGQSQHYRDRAAELPDLIGPRRALAQGALRRRAAAGSHRPGTGERAGDHLRRRADRQPRHGIGPDGHADTPEAERRPARDRAVRLPRSRRRPLRHGTHPPQRREDHRSAAVKTLHVSLFLAIRSLIRGTYGIAATTTLMMLLIYVSLLFLPSLIQGAINRVNAQLVNTLTSNIVITPGSKTPSIDDVSSYMAKIRQTAGVAQATAAYHIGTQVAYGANSGSWTVDAIDPATYGKVFTTPSDILEGRPLTSHDTSQVLLGIGIAGAGQSNVRGYRASLQSVHAGDKVSVTLTTGRVAEFTVAGIYDNQFPHQITTPTSPWAEHSNWYRAARTTPPPSTSAPTAEPAPIRSSAG